MSGAVRLGNYVLGEKLGTGATADVYRAVQPGVERDVAIKVMHAHLAGSPDFGARFQREARSMGQLRHPHIASVIDFESAGDHPYMVIEYLRAGSLYDYLEAHPGPLPIGYSVSIASQLADALAYAHAMGMVHRDLKPDNVMFPDDQHRHAVLTDFGIARLTDENLTAAGTMLGTPAYMAPEQVTGHGADAAADQYSLGVMLFEMVTGQRPFHAEGPHALMLRHTTEPVPSARVLNPEVPPELDALIARSMAKEPTDRFADVTQMRHALDLVDARPTGTAAETVVSSSMSTAPARSPWRIIGACLALVGAATAIGLFVTRNMDDPEVPTAAVVSTDRADSEPTPEPTAGSDAVDEIEPAAPVAATDEVAETVEAEEAPAAPAPPAIPLLDPANIPPLLVAAANIVDDRLLIEFDRSRQPGAGMTYVAWLDNVEGPIGVVAVDANGTARLDAMLPEAVLARALSVTEEPVDAIPQAPSGAVMLSTQMNEELRSDFDGLLGELGAAQRELAIAIEHDQLMRNEIALGSLAQTRRHAEHVVNILDGAGGENFGDLDGSGLAENPGDDVGVRSYVADAIARSESSSILGDGDMLRELQGIPVQVDQAMGTFARVPAADSLDEIESAGTDVGTLQLAATAADLARANQVVRWSVAQHLATGGAGIGAAGGSVSVSVGGTEVVVHSSAGRDVVSSADAPTVLLVRGDSDPVVLGRLDEFGSLSAPLEPGVLQELSAIRVATGSQGADVNSLVQVSAAVLPRAALDDVAAFVDGDEAILVRLGAQAQLAVDHVDLLLKAVVADDLDEVRRHAEHVVNIIEGMGGERFGDLDGNGVAENPGDDVGVLSYLNAVTRTVSALPEQTSEQLFYKTIWLDAVERIRQRALSTVEEAVRVLATDSTAEAAPPGETALAELVPMLDGFDADGNGVVDLFAGEIGVRGLARQAPTLVTAPLLPPD